ncbi:cytochrome C [Pseudomonas syringae pv. syringae PD2774]|uniref:c-type cytochrome n=1 Tax=Pseudomonas syringae TaxID=317 RepID=UPI0007362FC1|nr:cytochrome c [Pseudomonas syringae]KTB93858.1 cytochrome C [Pseudomonas syringae pv. syringae PD2774]
MSRWPWALCLALLCSGCDDMSRQAKVLEQRAGALFADGLSSRQPPAGSVARGQLQREASVQQRPALSAALLARGEAGYQTFCTPCHGLGGLGDGLVVGRGFPAPPSFIEPRLLNATDEQLMHVIAHGQGLMYGYESRIQPQERWTIVAHLRLLQLSQHADLDSLPAPLRQAFEARAQ